MAYLAYIRDFLDVMMIRMIRSRHTNRRMIISADLFVSTIGVFLSYYLCVIVYHNINFEKPNIWILSGLNMVLNYIFFRIMKTQAGIIRYSSYYEIWRILVAVALTNSVLMVLVFIFKYHQPISFTALVLNFTISLLLLIFVRYIIVQLYGRLTMNQGEKIQRGLVYGVTPDSVALARSILMSKTSAFKLVGFLTTDDSYSQTRIMDLPVYLLDTDDSGLTETDNNHIPLRRADKWGLRLKSIVAAFRIDTIIFSDKHILDELSDEFLKSCASLEVKVLLGQSPQDVSSGGLSSRKIRNIEIEDLLGRDEIEINTDGISAELNDRVVLVTGAAGSIGSEIVRQLARFNPKLLLLFDSAETPLHYMQLELEDKFPNLKFKIVLGDVRNQKRLTDLFKTHRPQIVYHAAAYKHVPLMENNPCEAILVNVLGTRNVVNHSVRYGAKKFVMISTDKAVNPSNVMGASKRIAELYVQALAKYVERKGADYRFITTRFGNVLGSSGSVIPRFRQQIEQGGPLSVTHKDITRFFMTIPEACRLVLEAGCFGQNGEIYVFDMGKPIKIDDLARKMIHLAGFVPDKDIRIEYTGLRPGEKLYEELLNDKEITKPTYHKKIMVATVRESDFREVTLSINDLIHLSKAVNTEKTVELMKELVPEFVSMNSIFEKLDK